MQVPNWLRRYVLRARGYSVGEDVRIGARSKIVGKRVRIERGVTIGRSVLISAESISIGAGVSIGDNTRIIARSIQIGCDSIITSDVRIEGFTHPESAFSMGCNSIVMYNTYIDTSRLVRIGNHVGVGGHCLLFTHGSWMNQYLGYPVSFASIAVEDGAWLPWRVFVLPGASIGRFSLIGANSLVSGAIPDRVLAVGSPAKVVRALEPEPLDAAERDRLTSDILAEFAEVMEMKGSAVERGQGTLLISARGARPSKRRVWVCHDANEYYPGLRAGDLVVGAEGVSLPLREEFRRLDIFWLDLRSFERPQGDSELVRGLCAVFLRHGVRFDRVSPAHPN